jgi:hypothetical protein
VNTEDMSDDELWAAFRACLAEPWAARLDEGRPRGRESESTEDEKRFEALALALLSRGFTFHDITRGRPV